MNQILHKTFLDSLLASTQQNPFAKSFAFDWARIAGNNSRITGNFGNGREYIGTNQDDTVVITGNVIGDDKNPTSIDLLDGNDTLTVRGKLIAKEGQHISITGGEGNNTVNLNGGINFTSTQAGLYGDKPIDITLNGSGTNTVNVKGNIVADSHITDSSTRNISNLSFTLGNNDELNSNKSIIDIDGSITTIGQDTSEMIFDLYSYHNSFTVHKNIIMKNNADLLLQMAGHENIFNLNGDFIADNSNLGIYSFGSNSEGETTSIDFARLTQVTNGGHIECMFDDGDYLTFKLNDVSLINGSINIEFGGASSDLSIKGDVKIDKGGSFDTLFYTDIVSTIEIEGQFILQGGTAQYQSSSRIWTENGDDLITF